MILAIDIGGTSIKYGIVNENKIIKKFSIETRAHEKNFHVMDRLNIIIKKVINEYPIKGIALSTAGVVNSKDGVVLYANENLPNYSGFNLAKKVIETYDCPCTVINDVKAAALSEMKIRGIDSMFMITIGTGIGGALVINGKVYEGKNYQAGEIGYLKYGNTSIENLISTTGLIKKYYEKTGGSLTGLQLIEKVRSGDQTSLTVISEWCKDIANILVEITLMYDPALIVLGGGIMESGMRILPLILENYKKMRTNKVEIAINGNEAGMLGAYYHFKETYHV